MTKRCVCQICSCGRHKCPHNPRSGLGFHGKEPCTFSEYANTYVQHKVEPRKNYKPQEQPVIAEGPMDGMTTSRGDYIQHPVEKPKVRKSEEYKRPEGDLDLKTSYAQQYTQKPGERAKPIRHEEPRREPGKFEGLGTYAADYPQWEVQKHEKVIRNDYMPPTAPFEGNSRYKSDFPMHARTPRESFKPVEHAVKSDAPFDGTTEARKSFVQHAIPRREVKEKEVWQPSTARMDGWSTSRKDYGPKEAVKQASYKPEAIAFRSTEPFDGASTQRSDFVGRQGERTWRREPETYRKPEGDLDLNTTARMAYTKKPMERTTAIKPKEEHVTPGKFEGTSNYHAEFRQWAGGDRAERVKREEYKPNDAPFEGKASYQLDYHAHRGAPLTRSLKPVEQEYVRGGPMDTTTEYNKQYIKKKTDSCHVPLLDQTKGKEMGYEFSEEDETGHRWYSLNKSLFVATAAGKFLENVTD